MARVNFELGINDPETQLAQSRRYLVGDVLEKNARANASATAVVSESECEMSYTTLNTRVNKLSNGLLHAGIGYGDRVAIISENRPEYVEVIYACAKIGAICATMNWRQAKPELVHCLDLVDADAIVISTRQYENHRWLASEGVGPETVITLDDPSFGQSYEPFLARETAEHPEPTTQPMPEDGLLIVYTSGTTGQPKGAILSHRALLHRAFSWKELSSMGPSYTLWKPMFHMMGTEPVVVAGIDGGTLYTIDGFEPSLILERYTRGRQGYLPLSLGSVDRLFETYNKEGYQPADFQSSQTIGSMADLYPAQKIKKITEAFDAEFLNTYGSTETGCAPLSGNTIPVGIEPADEDIYKTEGPMIDLKLVDEEWTEVSEGEYGELVARGPTLFSGYIGNRDANREAFHDGWFRTGDIFVSVADGKYDYIDRDKYLIKSGGENIYPAAIEQVLVDHGKISDACVTRTSDEKWGEVPKAYVALVVGSTVDKKELLTYLRGKIASYKLPHYIEFVDKADFPRSTTGKIRREEVEEWSVTDRIRDP